VLGDLEKLYIMKDVPFLGDASGSSVVIRDIATEKFELVSFIFLILEVGNESAVK
jgi:hypothetical protein